MLTWREKIVSVLRMRFVLVMAMPTNKIVFICHGILIQCLESSKTVEHTSNDEEEGWENRKPLPHAINTKGEV